MGSHEVGQGSPASVRTRRRDVAAAWLDPIRRRRASAYRAGPGVDEAVAVCRRLAPHGIASTIGYAAPPGEPARAVADVHLAAFERLAGAEIDCYVSIKLSALAFDAALFAELEAAAGQAARRLHVDALAPETVDATWRLLDGSAGAGRLGTTLPARWRRSADDASRAAERGLAVRVVKGQWAGADADGDAAEGFLRVVDRLCGHTAVVGVATHDVPLLSESLRRLTEAGISCEAELYYGLPFRAPALAARAAGVPIRVYVPYGESGAPYGAAELLRNPTALWWLTQDLVLGTDKTWRSVGR